MKWLLRAKIKMHVNRKYSPDCSSAKRPALPDKTAKSRLRAVDVLYFFDFLEFDKFDIIAIFVL